LRLASAGLTIVGVDRLTGAGGGVRARQRRRRLPDPFARERVGGWVGADRQERLDHLRQRIDAARSEHRGRQAGKQIGNR
jgi:hypothetical protein